MAASTTGVTLRRRPPDEPGGFTPYETPDRRFTVKVAATRRNMTWWFVWDSQGATLPKAENDTITPGERANGRHVMTLRRARELIADAYAYIESKGS